MTHFARGERMFSKPSPRWWRWLVVAGQKIAGAFLIACMATAALVLAINVARYVNWGML